MSQADVYRMIGRRARDAEVHTKIGCHSFRATGITEYLRNGGKPNWRSKPATMNPPAPRGSMTGATIKCHSMRLSGFDLNYSFNYVVGDKSTK